MEQRLDVLRTIEVMGKSLDIYGTANDPLFLAVDVALLIDYSDGHTGQMLDKIDPTEKLTSIIQRAGQRREMWFLTEDGFFEVLMQSRKPIARRFKRMVKDLLKDLRRKGEIDFEDMLNYEDPLVMEWEELNQQRGIAGLDELEWNDFLRTKGYTEDMLPD